MENRLLKGNVLKTLIQFALPVFAAMFLQSLYGGVDLLIIGQFAQTADVSGVATGTILMQTVNMVITGLAMGVTVYIGQKIGQGKREEAGKAVGTGVCLFAVIAFILTVLLFGFAVQLAGLLHAPQEAFKQTASYIRVCGSGMIFVVFYNLIGAIFRGIGDSKTPLLTVLIACAINIAGDLLFVCIFGMGAMGAAIATVFAQAVSVLISFLVISKKQLPFDYKKGYTRFDLRIVKTELRLGIPIALQEFLVGISFVVIQTAVNSIDIIASAGVGIAEKVCGFIMLVPSAYSQSISAFVAQNTGAGEFGRAKKSLKYGILTALCAAMLIATFTFFRGDLLAGIFAKDTAVIMQAHDYLKAYAIDTFLTSILFCFVGYYNGNGKTLFVMIQGLVGAVLVRIPVVFYMSSMADVTLFQIGLANLASSIVQIILCLCYLKTVDERNDTK